MTAILWLARKIEILSLRYRIYESERWMRACAEDGLLAGDYISGVQSDVSAMRARLYSLGGTE